MLRKVPLIVILGSTGTGKTKLSIELAERFGGEIISADSMQVYANLDIATAKATKAEQSRAKHHLLDVALPNDPFTVLSFRNAALPIIEKLLAQSKCPIVVGGTNYYIEALLWDILITPPTPTPPATSTATDDANLTKGGMETTSMTTETDQQQNLTLQLLSNDAMLKMSSQSLHDHLRTIDPESANRMHPNNKRKIMRAIEVYQQTGNTLTSILQEQRQQPGGNRLGGPLRYPHTILFWLRCNQEVLNRRLDKRVDAMLEQGLLREIRAFYNEHKLADLTSPSSSGNGPSHSHTALKNATDDQLYTKGVLQTIGFKEFVPYLEQFNAANDQKIEDYLRRNDFQMPTEEHFKIQKNCNSKAKRIGSINDPTMESNSNTSTAGNTTNTMTPAIVQQPNNNQATSSSLDSLLALPLPLPLPPGLELLNACLNELKLVTRRYSKKQIKWINNRFLASKDRQVPDLYELDTSDVSIWNEKVLQRAITIIDCFRNATICEIEPMPKRQHPGANLNEETSNFCTICQRHFIGEYQWKLHLKSNKHKKRKESSRKKEKSTKESVES